MSVARGRGCQTVEELIQAGPQRRVKQDFRPAERDHPPERKT